MFGRQGLYSQGYKMYELSKRMLEITTHETIVRCWFQLLSIQLILKELLEIQSQKGIHFLIQ